jgi:hypothetical protein
MVVLEKTGNPSPLGSLADDLQIERNVCFKVGFESNMHPDGLLEVFPVDPSRLHGPYPPGRPSLQSSLECVDVMPKYVSPTRVTFLVKMFTSPGFP